VKEEMRKLTDFLGKINRVIWIMAFISSSLAFLQSVIQQQGVHLENSACITRNVIQSNSCPQSIFDRAQDLEKDMGNDQKRFLLGAALSAGLAWSTRK
jgi:hypothetical protein